MKNSLVVIKDADEAIVIPGPRVRFISTTSATDVQINFDGEDNTEGSCNITVTSGKADEVIKELGRVLTSTNGSFLVGDKTASIFMPNVTDVAGVTISA